MLNMLRVDVTGLSPLTIPTRIELSVAVESAVAEVRKNRPDWKVGEFFPSYTEEKAYSKKIFVEVRVFGKNVASGVPQDLAQTIGEAVQQVFPKALVGCVGYCIQPAGVYGPKLAETTV